MCVVKRAVPVCLKWISTANGVTGDNPSRQGGGETLGNLQVHFGKEEILPVAVAEVPYRSSYLALEGRDIPGTSGGSRATPKTMLALEVTLPLPRGVPDQARAQDSDRKGTLPCLLLPYFLQSPQLQLIHSLSNSQAPLCSPQLLFKVL